MFDPDALASAVIAAQAGDATGLREIIRDLARAEVASLCGLALRRLQGEGEHDVRRDLLAIFGEALRDFGGTEEEPGA